MAVDSKELIELYKATLEELRHYDTTNTQAYIGVVIVIPIFLTAATFLLGEGSPISPQSILGVKWGILILAFIFTIFFAQARFRLNKRVEICIDVLNEIEEKLKESSIPENLLIIGQLNEIKGEKILTKKFLGIQLTLWIYIPIALVILAAFVSFLFFLM
jgi:hypothetical protein